jgi:hypothetical protein
LLIDLTIFFFDRDLLRTFYSLAKCRWNVTDEQNNVSRERWDRQTMKYKNRKYFIARTAVCQQSISFI